MKKLVVFDNVTLDGYFTDKNGDISWAHKDDSEWNDFVSNNASGEGVLIMGRITYEMMVSFWPTPMAAKQFPVVASAMNKRPKLVFSRTLDEATWENAKIIKGDLVEEIEKLKAVSDSDMVILGSGTIVSQLTQAGLIDEYQIVVHPVVIGDGRTLFDGVKERLPLNLTSSRVFENGAVLLHYATA